MPGLPRVPGLNEVVSLLRTQSEALAQLPRTLTELNRAVLSLVEVVSGARESIESTQRLTRRLERIVEELEEPVVALRPGLERLADILNDPAIDTIPDTLRSVSEDIVPLVKGLRDTQSKFTSVTSSAAPERITSLLGSLLRPRRPDLEPDVVDPEVEDLRARIVEVVEVVAEPPVEKAAPPAPKKPAAPRSAAPKSGAPKKAPAARPAAARKPAPKPGANGSAQQ